MEEEDTGMVSSCRQPSEEEGRLERGRENVVFGVALRLLFIDFVFVSNHQQTQPLTSGYYYKLAVVCRS